MNKRIIKEMGLVLSANRCIELSANMIENAKDRLKRTRSNDARKQLERSIEYFEAVIYHLKSKQN